MTITTGPTPVPSDVTATRAVLDDTYNDVRSRSVIVADGYGVRLHIRDGHLVIDDGLGDHRRTRKLTRSQRTVKRLLILSGSGSISLAAIRWCTDTGIDLICARADGTLDVLSSARDHPDARLRRAQALAAGNDVGLSIGRQLLTAKITGHADVLASIGADPSPLSPHLTAIAEAGSTVQLLDAESRAAAAYFAAWVGRVHVTFAGRANRVPDHWRTFTSRASRLQTTRTTRQATDPVNALLNYGYALGEAEARKACAALGLDPAFGVLHTDRARRDSFALDLLETLRPTIESTVLDMLARRPFGPVDFIETAEGVCRLTESVTHPLAASMTRWAHVLAPAAEAVAATLADNAAGQIQSRTPLTHRTRNIGVQPGRKRRSAQRQEALATVAVLDRRCEHCGRGLTGSARKVCADCRPAQQIAHLDDIRTRSQNQHWRERVGSDEVRGRRAAGVSANRAATNTWRAENGQPPADRAAFTRDITPALATIATRTIADALGVSTSSALKIKQGKLIPHVRHWGGLNDLIASIIGA